MTVEDKPSNDPTWLSQEMLDSIVKKETALDSLSEDQQKEFHSFMEQKILNPDAPQEKPSEPKDETPEFKPEDVPAPESKKLDFWEKYNQKAAEANRNKQIAENLERKTREMEAKLAEFQKGLTNKPANPNDHFDEGTQANREERLTRIEQMMQTYLEHNRATSKQMQDEYAERAASLEKERSMIALETLQHDDSLPAIENLKTSVPVSKLNAELETFSERMGGIDNVNKYLNDPAYKAEAESRGLKLSDAFIQNLPKFNEIWDLNREVQEGKYPDHATAYLSRLYKTGTLKSLQDAAKLAGANAVVASVANKGNQTPMLPVGGGESPKATGWTAASALAWIRSHQDILPGSPEERIQRELNELVSSGQLR